MLDGLQGLDAGGIERLVLLEVFAREVLGCSSRCVVSYYTASDYWDLAEGVVHRTSEGQANGSEEMPVDAKDSAAICSESDGI